jgi:hypothetical protein
MGHKFNKNIKNLQKWKNFISESKKDVPFELKKICSIIKDKIKHQTRSFSQYFDFRYDQNFPISFTLKVNISLSESNEIYYKAYVDTLSIVKSSFEEFEIPIDIIDKSL